MNIFDKNNIEVNNKPKSKAKKEETPRVEITEVGFYEDVKELSDIKKELEVLQEREKELLNSVKETAINKWCDIYATNKTNPKTVIFYQKYEDIIGELLDQPTLDQDISIAEFTLIPTDKYITIKDEKSKDILIEKYSSDIINEDITYIVNNKMVEKYSDILSKLILECEEIKEEDKELIIEAKTVYSIKKGTIDELSQYSESIDTILEDVKPVFSTRDFKCINS